MKLYKKSIREIHRILMEDFHANPAPIIDFMAAQGYDPFKILVATILSARTRDETTSHVVRNQLFPVVKDFDDLRRLTLPEIEKLIYPVGFYRQKAKALHALPDAVQDRFGGRIPDTVEELCELPGVGRKTANLVVARAFNKPAICVDIHVHRIMNRLGLVKTKTPLETEMELRRILPEDIWIDWNGCFVSHGQRICTPRNPKCDRCRVRPFCATGSAKKA
jgi:endonuclease III